MSGIAVTDDESTSFAEIAIGLGQFAPGADPRANLAEIARLTERAADAGARLVVFPEYAASAHRELGPEWQAASQPLDGAFATGLSQLASRLGVTVVAGLGERLADDPLRVANTVVAVGPAGRLLARYRKLHLYDAFGRRESDWLVPGEVERPAVVDVDGVSVGLQTCYDLRFPEVTRRLVDAGAQLVVVPAQWARGPLKEHHWRTLATARAIENTVYVAAVGQTPPLGVGGSILVDPMGVVVAGAGEQSDAVIGRVSTARLAEIRRVNPSLQLRRFRVEPR